MSHKFLPFVVQSSSPEYIYKTLISRSKGISESTIAGVFHIVLKHGIETIRKVVKTLPEELSVSDVYKELLMRYPTCQIEPDYIHYVFVLFGFYDKENELIQELQEFDKDQIAIFFAALSLTEKWDLASSYFLKETKFVENIYGLYQSVPLDIPLYNIRLANYIDEPDALTIVISSEEGIKASLVYHHLEETKEPLYFLKYEEEKENATP